MAFFVSDVLVDTAKSDRSPPTIISGRNTNLLFAPISQHFLELRAAKLFM